VCRGGAECPVPFRPFRRGLCGSGKILQRAGEAGEDIQSGQGGGFFRRCRWRRKRLKGSPFRIKSGANAVFQCRRRFVPSEDLSGAAEKEQKENASVEEETPRFPTPGGHAEKPLHQGGRTESRQVGESRYPERRKEPTPKVRILFKKKTQFRKEPRPERGAEKESHFGNVQQVCSERLKEKHAAEASRGGDGGEAP
jgi:hypothetical protein